MGHSFQLIVKYDIKDKNVDTFIINGAECEPYLTADYSVMKYFTKEIINGIKIVSKIINPKKVVIGIEDENKDLKKVFEKTIKEIQKDKKERLNIKIQLLPTSYPQGSELQLIQSITGKKIKKGDLPVNSGIIVNNVSTLKSINDAFVEGKPLTERVITISGEKISKLGNYMVKTGITLDHIVNSLNPDETAKTIFGGPMMGSEVLDKNTPIVKGTSGILFLETENIVRDNCISCGYCVEVCPMGLVPLEFADIYSKGKYEKLEKVNIMNCIECGACEFACPSRVPLIDSIKNGKTKLSELGAK